jgi:hypothetical protein
MRRRYRYAGPAIGLSSRLHLRKLDKDAEKNYKKFFRRIARSEKEAVKLTLQKWEENLRIITELAELRDVPFHRKVRVVAKLPIKLDTNPLCWTCAPLCPLAPRGLCVGLCSEHWRHLRRAVNKGQSPVMLVDSCKNLVAELRRLKR